METLQWRHDEHDVISNPQPHDCLLNRLFRQRSKKTSKLRISGFVWGIHQWPVNSPHKGPVTRKMLPFDDINMPNVVRNNWRWEIHFKWSCIYICIYHLHPYMKHAKVWCKRLGKALMRPLYSIMAICVMFAVKLQRHPWALHNLHTWKNSQQQ